MATSGDNGAARTRRRPRPVPRAKSDTRERQEREGTLLQLQHAAGNAAVSRLVGEITASQTPVVMRLTEPGGAMLVAGGPGGGPTGVVGGPGGIPATPAVAAAGRVSDPAFNPGTRVNDLARAIDSKDYDYVFTTSTGLFGGPTRDPSKERRKVDFGKVAASLGGLSPSQAAEVERRYEASRTGSTLRNDLLGGGESDRPADLTADQRAQIEVLLKGTKPEPIPEAVLARLASMPPEEAAKIAAGMLAEADKTAAMNRLELEAIELHTALAGIPTREKKERALALHRVPLEHIQSRDAVYDARYGSIRDDLNGKLFGTSGTRMNLLRQGDIAGADACLIEEKRQEIEALDAADAKIGDDLFSLAKKEENRKKRQALTADIMGVVEQHRQEALAEAGADPTSSVSAGAAVAERVGKLLQKVPGGGSDNLGALLEKTLDRRNAAAIAALGDAGKAANSQGLIEHQAALLAADERAGTTRATKIIATLRSFRDLARQDLLAAVHDPAVPLATKESIGADIEGAVDATTGRYIAQYKASYHELRGLGGRSFEAIVASADAADEALINALATGGGKASEVTELQHAMGKRDMAKVKAILKEQPNREAVDELVAAYNASGKGRDLRRELFGATAAGQTLDASQASGATPLAMADMVRGSRGMASGRDAAVIGEELAKPSAAALANPTGLDEAKWLTGGGLAEFSATMANRGLTGDLRAIGDDPETQRLLETTKNRMVRRFMELSGTTDPVRREQLMLEMRRDRATLTGDAAAYEEDNARVRAQLQSAVSFAVSIALALAIPGAGAGVAAFLKTAAINIAASVATNAVIKGDAYSWADLQSDILSGALGAAGGKLGEELVGAVATKIATRTAQATVDATAKAGLQTALAREIATLPAAARTVAIDALEMEAKLAGLPAAANVVSLGGRQAEARLAAAALTPGQKLFMTGAKEVGGFFGGLYGGKIPSGDFNLTMEELLKNLATTAAGKAGGRLRAGAGGGGSDGSGGSGSGGSGSGGSGGGGGSGRRGGDGAGEVHGPRSPSEMMLQNGMHPDTGKAFQAATDDLNVIIKVRPTNADSLAVTEAGGLPKPELAKSKTANPLDELIGGPPGARGKVAFFEPRLPRVVDLAAMPPDQQMAVIERYAERKAEYDALKPHYDELAGQGLIRIEGGVLQFADPRSGGAGAGDAGAGDQPAFKEVGGDHDIYEITGPRGEPLTDLQRKVVIDRLRSMGIKVEHPDHVSWATDSPDTYKPSADEAIRRRHSTDEPLLTFVPRSQPGEALAGTEVVGPDRTEGPGDRFMPADSASEVPGVDLYQGPTDEIDFSLAPGEGIAPGRDPAEGGSSAAADADSAVRVEGLPDDFLTEEPTRPDRADGPVRDDDFATEEPTRPGQETASGRHAADEQGHARIDPEALRQLEEDLARPRTVPAEGHPEGLSFGPLDLLYGPSARGALRELWRQAGGRVLNDLAESVAFPNFFAKSRAALDWARQHRAVVHFDLTHVPDVAAVLAGTGPKAGAVTSFELRYIRQHWDDSPPFRGLVVFYRAGRPLDRPPWEAP